MCNLLYQTPLLAQYRKRIQAKAILWTSGHCVYDDWSSSWRSTREHDSLLFILYRYKSCSKCGTGIPLGQTAGQKIIQEFQDALAKATEKIQDLDEEDFGIVSPGLELAQMMHERVNIRIFMS